MDTTSLLRARQSGQWSRVKLLDNDKMSYSVEGKPSLDIGRMTLEYCLTSPVIDREGDLILPDAPDWTDHERNPLTLFNHKLDQPFGKSQDTAGRYTVERRGDRWYGKSYLFQNDPFAEEVYRLAEKGALNGASIGFLPAKPPFGQSSVKHMNGYDYTVIERCKVFEWSAVYIPMNQDALLVAAEVVRKGLGNKPLSDRAKAMFLPYVPEAPVWANGWTKAAGWNESDHPRADDGKFGEGSGKPSKDNKKQSSILSDEKKLSSLSGAPEGATVEVSPDEDGKGSMIYFSDPDKKQRLYSGAIYVRDDGDGLKMKIESLDIRPDAQGQGIGKKIVGEIIANAKANGIEEISVGARRADGMNGYYSWARYGFDCPIPFDKVLPLPKSLGGSKTVQDLMKTKEGRDWWKENGISVRMYLNPQKGEKSFRHGTTKAAGWNEADHPRADDGKFGNGGGKPSKDDKKHPQGKPDAVPKPGDKRFDMVEKLARTQAIEANYMRGKQGLKPLQISDYELKWLPLDEVKPSQHGEDYKNASSEELAKKIGEFLGTGRKQDYAPIVVDEDMNIIDGNHRHAARVMAGIKEIPVLVPKKKGEKSLAPTLPSNKPVRLLNGKFKMYDSNTDDQMTTPVDPIEAKAEDNAPASPLGAQLISGLHEIAMTAAKFYTDNVGQLEPELAQTFTSLEKVIMGAIASMAQMFNGRYADLPPLDGADWVDPDMDGDIDTTDDPELNPDQDDLDMEEAKSISEETANSDDATAEDADATDDEDDATPDADKSDKADQQRTRSDEDAHDDEEADAKPRFKKSFEEAARRSLKALLDGWQAKQKALKDAAKRIEHPDAIVAVKAAAQFLRTMAGDPREDKALRGRAKKLRSDLLNALPKVKAKAVVEIAPVALDIDLDKIADHFNSARKAMEVDAQAIQDKINKLFQLTGR